MKWSVPFAVLLFITPHLYPYLFYYQQFHTIPDRWALMGIFKDIFLLFNTNVSQSWSVVLYLIRLGGHHESRM